MSLRRLALTSLAAAMAAPALVGVASAQEAGGESLADDTVVLAVEVDATADDAEVEELAETLEAVAVEAGGEVRLADDGESLLSVEVPESEVAQASEQIASVESAARVERSAKFELLRRPRDPQFRLQRGYLNQIRVPRAWNRTTGSSDVLVAVVDSGVAADHPDLRGKIVGRLNAVNGGTVITDLDGHGTAVASVAAASTSNRSGIAGVGWRSSLLAAKVSDSAGQIWGDAVARGIRWATEQGADVINLSLGSTQDDPFVRRAVADAVSAGVVVVAAVSNAGLTRPVYPAAYPGVLSVGATSGPRLAPFSDPTGVVAAPGVALRAAVPGGYRRVEGTSFAAAIVSGQAALLRAAAPDFSAARITRLIANSARVVGPVAARANRVDVFASVRRASGVASAPRDVRVRSRAGRVVLTWSMPIGTGRQPIRAYTVDVRKPGQPWRQVARVDESTFRAVVRGLDSGATYRVRVRAVSDAGLGVPRARMVRVTG